MSNKKERQHVKRDGKTWPSQSQDTNRAAFFKPIPSQEGGICWNTGVKKSATAPALSFLHAVQSDAAAVSRPDPTDVRAPRSGH